MATVRDNAIRVKRFRELKATLRTDRTRLLVGIDVAQAEHVVHLRHAHTRVVVPSAHHPEHHPGLHRSSGRRIQQAQRATGCREVVCGLEPTGTYHQAVATFLETQGADVVLLLQQRGLLEPPHPGRDLGQARPEGRRELRRPPGAGQGALLLAAHRPARRAPAPREVSPPGPDRTRELQGPLADHAPAGPGADGGAAPATPLGRAARRPPGLGAGRPRPAGGAEGAAAARPGHGLRRSRGPGHRGPGPDRGARGGAAPRSPSGCRPTGSSGRSRASGPRWARSSWPRSATLGGSRSSASSGSSRGSTSSGCSPGSSRGRPRISKCGRGLLRWALYHAAVGAGADGGRPRAARGLQGEAPGRSLRRVQGRRGIGREAAPGRVGRVAERDPVRSHAGGGAPAAGPLSGRRRHSDVFPGEQAARLHNVAAATRRPRRDTGAPLPLSSARTRPGGSARAARRPDGTTTMGHERSSRERSRGTTADGTCAMRSAFGIERRILP